MNLSNFDNHPKISAFKKFNHVLYKYYPSFFLDLHKWYAFKSLSCSFISLRVKTRLLLYKGKPRNYEFFFMKKRL